MINNNKFRDMLGGRLPKESCKNLGYQYKILTMLENNWDKFHFVGLNNHEESVYRINIIQEFVWAHFLTYEGRKNIERKNSVYNWNETYG